MSATDGDVAGEVGTKSTLHAAGERFIKVPNG